MSPSNGTDYKSQVLSAINLVELIGQSVALKRRGKDYVGLCPFHKEKTPSFYVKPDKQYFVCYGCKKHGNAIDFITERDRVDFKEALMMLGRQAGIEMPKFGVSRQKPGEKQALLDAHSAACAFYEKQLQSDAGQVGREYLEKRGINAESIKRFQIGLAVDSWNALLNSPVGKKFGPQTLTLAGLVKPNQRGDGYYDTFRNRLLFPIRDESARIIAFGGRVLPGSEDPAKYLNSPETPLFSKSDCVFGLDLARQRIVETRTVAIVEGYTDTVMAHQFGVSNVVSILGTAMTEKHLAKLRRFADRIVLLFDADFAGDTAVDRVVELFLRQPVEIAIATMPQGMDPDEYLLKEGAEAFEKLLAGATDALSYKWTQLSRQFVTSRDDLTGRQKAVEQYLALLAGARGADPVDPIRWGQSLVRVSRLTEISVPELNRMFKAKGGKGKSVPPELAENANVANNVVVRRAPTTGQDKVERRILGILLGEPQRWFAVQQHVHAEDFTEESRRRLAEIYWRHQQDEGEPVFNEFLSLLDPGLSELAVELLDEVESLPDPEQVVAEALEHFARIRRRQAEEKLLAAARRTDDAKASEQDQLALLQRLLKTTKPDLSKIGPDLRRGGK